MNKSVHLSISHTCNDDENAEIELIAFEQKWVGEVALDDHLLRGALRHVPEVLEEYHAVALAATLRLGNEDSVRVLLLIGFKRPFLLREDKGPGREVVLFSILTLGGDTHHVLVVVFASQFLDGWRIAVDQTTRLVSKNVEDLFLFSRVPKEAHVPFIIR